MAPATPVLAGRVGSLLVFGFESVPSLLRTFETEESGVSGVVYAPSSNTCIWDWCTKMPCPSLQVKYFLPWTVPSFLPFASSRITPTHLPVAKRVAPTCAAAAFSNRLHAGAHSQRPGACLRTHSAAAGSPHCQGLRAGLAT